MIDWGLIGVIYGAFAALSIVIGTIIILGLAGLRGFKTYVKYVKTGKVKDFNSADAGPYADANPATIVFESSVFFTFVVIMSLLWGVSLLMVIICGIAWCNRRGYLKWKEKDRIIARLAGRQF